jgi:hypothetical protein
MFGDQNPLIIGLPVGFRVPAGTAFNVQVLSTAAALQAAANPAGAQAAHATVPTASPAQALAAAAPLVFHSAFKISENESPFPQTRAFVTYNYFGENLGSGAFFGQAPFQVHRELVGGEYAFADNQASIGIRAPIFETRGGSLQSSDDSQFGDVSVIFKYALWLDRKAGNVFSGGMVITTPTGPSLPVTGQSSINSTIFQPFAAFQWTAGDFYLQNYSSVIVPTDTRDITMFFESISLGYWLYRARDRSSCLTGVIPTAEIHANLPFNHQSLSSQPIGLPETVDFTTGSYFQFGRSVLGLAVGAPLTGPRVYNIEAIASLNFYF